MSKKTNTVLVNAMVSGLKDAKVRIKNGSLESICAAHLHNELKHQMLIGIYGCNKKQASRILSILNELVPRDNNKGADDMATAAKKTATKPATKKTAAKPAAKKKDAVVKTPQVKKNDIAQPREGTTTRKVWDGLDAMQKKAKKVPTRKEATAELAPEGFHKGTIGVQYRNWAIFNGCYAKAPKKAPVAKKPAAAKKPAGKRPVAKKVPTKKVPKS